MYPSKFTAYMLVIALMVVLVTACSNQENAGPPGNTNAEEVDENKAVIDEVYALMVEDMNSSGAADARYFVERFLHYPDDDNGNALWVATKKANKVPPHTEFEWIPEARVKEWVRYLQYEGESDFETAERNWQGAANGVAAKERALRALVENRERFGVLFEKHIEAYLETQKEADALEIKDWEKDNILAAFVKSRIGQPWLNSWQEGSD